MDKSKFGTSLGLSSIYFIGADTGYVVGQSGIVLKTTNAGITWIIMTSENYGVLESVYFTDAVTGYATGWGGTIIKTTDGGSKLDCSQTY